MLLEYNCIRGCCAVCKSCHHGELCKVLLNKIIDANTGGQWPDEAIKKMAKRLTNDTAHLTD